jgi:CBS domain containing-hemolysin-like protein
MDILDNGISLLAAAATGGGETSGTIGGLILFITIAIGFSFLCSMLEAGILSTPSSYIETQAKTAGRAGRLMQRHKQNVEEPITAILTLNTFAHTVGAAGAGAQAVGVFGSAWAGLITVILTLLILVFSEIIPKTVGAVYWKQLFTFNAFFIQLLILSLYPAVWLFNQMTRLITPEEKLPTVTRGELEMMAQVGATEGALEKQESLIVNNLFQLNRVQIYDIMTPRTVMLAFQEDLTIGEVLKGKRTIPYSRIPVYREHIDDITGFVLRHDIYRYAANDQHDVTLKSILRPIHSVPEPLNVAKVLEEFMARQQHIFLVIDEYGGTSGIITMEDAVESLLGSEITDESDVVADMRQLAEQRYHRQQEMLEAVNLKPGGISKQDAIAVLNGKEQDDETETSAHSSSPPTAAAE